MSHASRKRSRQEPGDRVVHHPHNNKRILEDYEDQIVARNPNKGINLNADTERNEKDHDKSQWNTTAQVQYFLLATEPGKMNASKIKFHNLEYGYDQNLIHLYDRKEDLELITPTFTASVTVQIPPISDDVNCQVGWVQVCSYLHYVFTYGNKEHILSWEVPELVTGKDRMVSDADGTLYPWYDSTTAVADVKGPSYDTTFHTVIMSDNLCHELRWIAPGKVTDEPDLTFAFRKQRFYLYLVLKDLDTNICQIIKTITWTLEFAIDIDPTKPLGERATYLGPAKQEIPYELPYDFTPPLDDNALNPPMINDCQICTWRRHRHGVLELAKPPQHTTMTVIDDSCVKSENKLYRMIDRIRRKYLDEGLEELFL